MSKYVASCSFGKDSIAQIILAKEHGEPLDEIIYSEVMFDKDISGEIPEQRDFIYNTAKPKLESWGYKVQILRANTNYMEIFNRTITRSKNPERLGKRVGFPMAGKCAINRSCKIEPIRKYYRQQNMQEVIQYIGIATDEPKRLKKLDGVSKVSLLDRYGYTEEMAKEKAAEYGLLSPIYSFAKRGGVLVLPQYGRLRNATLKK